MLDASKRRVTLILIFILNCLNKIIVPSNDLSLFFDKIRGNKLSTFKLRSTLLRTTYLGLTFNKTIDPDPK